MKICNSHALFTAHCNEMMLHIVIAGSMPFWRGLGYIRCLQGNLA